MLPYRCPAHKWRAHKLRAFTARCSRSGRCESEPRSVLRALTCYETSTSVNMFALSWLLEVVLLIVLLVYSLRCRYLCASICERPSTAYWHFLRQTMMEIWGESTVTYDIYLVVKQVWFFISKKVIMCTCSGSGFASHCECTLALNSIALVWTFQSLNRIDT